MKNQIYIVIAGMFLFPLTASAGYIGSGVMEIGYSTPTAGNYYADYDKISYNRTSGKEINFASDEFFCVEHDNLITPTTYDFYNSDGVGAIDLLETWATNYEKVTWIANWATTTTNAFANTAFATTDLDEIKAIGQVAIWSTLEILNVGNIDQKNALNNLYGVASDGGAYVNDWLLAESYSYNGSSNVIDGQNYLVKVAPVPEPTTMLLFGTGLIGLAGMARRRKKS